MSYFVYVIKSETTGRIYIGQTGNLRKRLKRHNRLLPTKSKSYTVANKGPWKLVYKEKLETRNKARKREKELKSYRGREYIKEVIGPVAQW